MYIAICDDDPTVRHQLSAALEAYAAAHSLPMSCRVFSDAEAMLRSAGQRPFTHYFLDVMMPGMDGVTAAHEIRSFDEHAKIVFLSSFREYAYEGFQVRAYDYLLKPVKAGTLSALLDRLAAQEGGDPGYLSIRNGRSMLRLPLSQLVYLEVCQKKLHFHLANGQLRVLPGTISSVEAELLAHPGFMKIHRSYIVSLRHVSSLSPEGCVLLSGDSLPISRLLYQQVRREYMAYLFTGTEE